MPVATYGYDPFIAPDIHLGSILGTFTHKAGLTQHVITFKKDYTFVGTCYVNGRVADEYEGTWKMQSPYIGDPLLHYTYTKSGKIPVGTKDVDTVEVLNDTALKVITRNGQNTVRRIWWRVATKP